MFSSQFIAVSYFDEHALLKHLYVHWQLRISAVAKSFLALSDFEKLEFLIACLRPVSSRTSRSKACQPLDTISVPFSVSGAGNK